MIGLFINYDLKFIFWYIYLVIEFIENKIVLDF